MYIIGELINGMFKDVSAAIQSRDKKAIQDKALSQINAGADALDINCGPLSVDPESDMQWLVTTIQEVTEKTLCIDSSKPEVIAAAFSVIKNSAIINSATADDDKLVKLLPLAVEFNAKLIALAIDKQGIPQDKNRRVELAAKIVSYAQDNGFNLDNILLDPIVMPVKVAQNQMLDVLEAIREFKIISDPAPKTIIGLSNVSQGVPKVSRGLINRAFLTMAQSYGLDAAIANPLDKDLLESTIAVDLILNRQIYCDSFLDAYRKE